MQLYILSLLFLSNLVASLTLTPISRDNDVLPQEAAVPQCKTSRDCANGYYCRRGGCVKIPRWPPSKALARDVDVDEDSDIGVISPVAISQAEIVPRDSDTEDIVKPKRCNANADCKDAFLYCKEEVCIRVPRCGRGGDCPQGFLCFGLWCRWDMLSTEPGDAEVEEVPEVGDGSTIETTQPEIEARELIRCKSIWDCASGFFCLHNICVPVLRSTAPPSKLMIRDDEAEKVPEVEDDSLVEADSPEIVPNETIKCKALWDCPRGFYCLHEICVPVGANPPSPQPDKRRSNRDCPRGRLCRDGKCARIRRLPPQLLARDAVVDIEEASDTGDDSAIVTAPLDIITHQNGEADDNGDNKNEDDDGVVYLKCKGVRGCPRHYLCLNGRCLPFLRPPPQLSTRDTDNEQESNIDDKDENDDEAQAPESDTRCRNKRGCGRYGICVNGHCIYTMRKMARGITENSEEGFEIDNEKREPKYRGRCRTRFDCGITMWCLHRKCVPFADKMARDVVEDNGENGESAHKDPVVEPKKRCTSQNDCFPRAKCFNGLCHNY